MEAAAPNLKSPKRTGRAHEFFVGRARVSGHRGLGEAAKGAASARQYWDREQPRLAGERAFGPRISAPPALTRQTTLASRPSTSFPRGNCKAARKAPGEPWFVRPRPLRHQETPRHSGPCTIAKVRGRAAPDPTSRLHPGTAAAPHLGARPGAQQHAHAGDPAARPHGPRAACGGAVTGSRARVAARRGARAERAKVGCCPQPARVLTCCCFLGRPRPLF